MSEGSVESWLLPRDNETVWRKKDNIKKEKEVREVRKVKMEEERDEILFWPKSREGCYKGKRKDEKKRDSRTGRPLNASDGRDVREFLQKEKNIRMKMIKRYGNVR